MKRKERKLVSTIRKVFVDDLEVSPIITVDGRPRLTLDTVFYHGKRLTVGYKPRVLCTKCHHMGVYVESRGRYVKCPHCDHVLTTIR